MSIKSMLRSGMLLVTGLVLFACGGPKRPDWIMKGAGAFKDRQNVLRRRNRRRHPIRGVAPHHRRQPCHR
jgi:hypothetical protein